MPEEFEKKESKPEPLQPALLDVVKIDGRWTQVLGGGEHIRFLDDATVQEINWDDYEITKRFRGAVGSLKLQHGEKIEEEETANIHWGPEEKGNPGLKKLVTVFAEYKKR